MHAQAYALVSAYSCRNLNVAPSAVLRVQFSECIGPPLRLNIQFVRICGRWSVLRPAGPALLGRDIRAGQTQPRRGADAEGAAVGFCLRRRPARPPTDRMGYTGPSASRCWYPAACRSFRPSVRTSASAGPRSPCTPNKQLWRAPAGGGLRAPTLLGTNWMFWRRAELCHGGGSARAHKSRCGCHPLVGGFRAQAERLRTQTAAVGG